MNKTKRVEIRIEQRDYDKFKPLARSLGLNMSEFIRLCIQTLLEKGVVINDYSPNAHLHINLGELPPNKTEGYKSDHMRVKPRRKKEQ